ncbi:hypothetical protein [Nonomuraea guangzhouensis]|uniref:Subtilisin inhibitor domain-containing protein n=1 Tax=Nonomuraea guangzhouensis TaxID=1291555 RepID=A0ABW4GS14_9ACTN|nr:hypothetical protein [Nonomuraea guangzhouensis]
MLRAIRPGRAACAAIAAIAGVIFMAAPAHADVGRLTFFADTAFSQPTTNISYSSCDAFIGLVPGQQVGSFDNRPPSGCQVILHALSGDLTLCVGRAIVPPALRRAFFYEIRTGASVPCAV